MCLCLRLCVLSVPLALSLSLHVQEIAEKCPLAHRTKVVHVIREFYQRLAKKNYGGRSQFFAHWKLKPFEQENILTFEKGVSSDESLSHISLFIVPIVSMWRPFIFPPCTLCMLSRAFTYTHSVYTHKHTQNNKKRLHTHTFVCP